jgi:hypothetical protein
MVRNLIFLDIDGVLNTESSLVKGIHICPDKVVLLYEVVKETDCKVVISSSWRLLYTLTEIKEILYLSGFRDRYVIIDHTPFIHEFGKKFDRKFSRGFEIARWIGSRHEVYNYVILDDIDEFLPYQKSRFVHIDSELGLTENNLENIKKVLYF